MLPCSPPGNPGAHIDILVEEVVGGIDDAVERILGEARQEARRPPGGPRSRLVEAIMVLLLSRPMRSAEIARILGYETRYISSYLSYWRSRGYVEYENGYWTLTPRGEEFAHTVLERETGEELDRMATIARRILSQPDLHGKPARKGKKGAGQARAPGGSLPFTADKSFKAGNKLQEREAQARCLLVALQEDLDPEELEALASLLAHYTRWGSTYIYLDNLAEEMKADYTWLLKVMRRLQSKGIVYIYTDPRLGIRVGLTKSTKEMLSACTPGA